MKVDKSSTTITEYDNYFIVEMNANSLNNRFMCLDKHSDNSSTWCVVKNNAIREVYPNWNPEWLEELENDRTTYRI